MKRWPPPPPEDRFARLIWQSEGRPMTATARARWWVERAYSRKNSPAVAKWFNEPVRCCDYLQVWHRTVYLSRRKRDDIRRVREALLQMGDRWNSVGITMGWVSWKGWDSKAQTLTGYPMLRGMRREARAHALKGDPPKRK